MNAKLMLQTSLLLCLLPACSAIKSSIKEGELHFKHHQLIFSIPTSTNIEETTCQYKQRGADWEYRYQTRACLEFTLAGDEWLWIFSRDETHIVFVKKNNEIMYLLPEPYTVDT